MFLSKHLLFIVALFTLSLTAAPSFADQANAGARIQLTASGKSHSGFLCWTPVSARVLFSQPLAKADILTIRSVPVDASSGSLLFSPKDRPIDAAKDKLAISLESGASSAEFKVMGSAASRNGKDVSIIAELSDGREVAALPVMVRVRKNAEDLTAAERDAFLKALSKWKSRRGAYRATSFEDLYTIHADGAHLGIHSEHGTTVSNFLPWHRAFLLQFERELQQIDPTVAVPYWKFDEKAPKLFSKDFLGTLDSNSSLVLFAPSNPIRDWKKGADYLVRSRVFPDRAAIAPFSLDMILCDEADSACPSSYHTGLTTTLELNYHSNVHGAVLGWLGAPDAPSDPLFFLLHANVDRAWAHWQAKFKRFDQTGADPKTYSPIGGYPGPAIADRYRIGLYALDYMWPWRQTSLPSDKMTIWPPYSLSFPSVTEYSVSSESPPTPSKMIDFMGQEDGRSAEGVCYDDVFFANRK